MSVAISDLMVRSGVGFGTSGARGLVSSMTDKVCYLYTLAFLQHMEHAGHASSGARVAVAGDFRPSTPRIAAACLKAVEDAGFKGVYCGFVPSPAVALYGMTEHIPSIMVTGSHIPDDRNGIKFNTPSGEILKEDEAAIREQRVDPPQGLFNEVGEFLEEVKLPAIDPAAREIYRRRYLDILASDSLAGMRIGVYQHSGVSRDLLVDILEELGAEGIALGRSDRFVPVDTEAIRPEDMELAKRWVREHRLDSVVSTDGDGDRPLVSDENGEWLRGDIAGILCARFLKADVVVTPVSSNSAVELSGLFNEVTRTRIGSPYVIAGMEEARAAGKRRVMGYEANGGFLQADSIHLGGGMLSPLPTRDALIVILAILIMSREQQTPVSRLVASLPGRYTYSDRLKEFPTELGQARLSGIADSGEAEARQRVMEIFGDRFGEVAKIDVTDGVRITFSRGDIVHLRPSGNAPELRCYTEADSPGRAREVNAICLGIMEGWRS